MEPREHSIFSKIQHIYNIIDGLCKPTHKYLKDKTDQEVSHMRTRTLVIIHIFVILIFVLDLLQKKGPILTNVIGIVTCFIIIIFLLVSCRYHPEVFNVFYNVLIAVYGPHLAYTEGNEGLHTAWLSVFTFPTFVVLATGSLRHYLIHCGCQVFFLNTVYQGLMEKHIEFASPQSVVRTLTYASNQAMVLNVLFVGTITLFLHRAYSKISVVERKKEESERQKTFLLGFSHELRNLINSLMGNVKLASLENISERVKDLMLNAEVCGELLIHLVNNILDTGKVEIGDLEINPIPVRVNSILEKVWGVCLELIKRKNLRGKMRICKNIPTCLKLDHYRLTQIFLNLVGNAVKFTDQGSVDISVEWIKGAGHVNDKCFEPYPFNDDNDQEEGIFEKSQALSLFNENIHCLTFRKRKISQDSVFQTGEPVRGVLKIVVSDTGCGILKEDIQKLFHKFTQVTSDVSKRKLGTGLGLFITKELCNRMNGDVRVFSKKGKGSSFICCIPVEPVAEEKLRPLDTESTKNLIVTRNLRALVVDDVQFNHIILRDFFSRLGVEVVDYAENGLQAYEKYKSHKSLQNEIHIVTMDLCMPIMDGKEAARKIREFEADNGLDPCLLIVVSANCAESEISECTDAKGKIRANAFLKKPATIEDLLGVIGGHLADTRTSLTE